MSELDFNPKKLNLKQHFILIATKFMGLIGFEVFSLSERLVNRKFNLFFSQFPSSLQFDSSYDYKKEISNILNRHFKERININYLRFLVEAYYCRVLNRPKEEMLIPRIDYLFIESKLSLEDYFLIAKYLSKLGHFSLANEIENLAKKKLLFDGFNSTHELFQTIKIFLYEQTNYVDSFLRRLGLKTHFIKYYNIHLLLNKLEKNFENRAEPIYILGPLREVNNINSFFKKDVALTRPNPLELDLVYKGKFRKVFLYTKEPIDSFTDGVLNVADYVPQENAKVKRFSFLLRFLLINGYPSYIARVLLHQLFQTSNKHFSINYATFHLSKHLYSNNYSSNRIENLENIEFHEVNDLIWRLGWHDLLSNFRFSKFLYDSGLLINNSKITDDVLSLSVADYAIAMEKNYNTVERNNDY